MIIKLLPVSFTLLCFISSSYGATYQNTTHTEDLISSDQAQEPYKSELSSDEELKKVRFRTYTNFEISRPNDSARFIATSPSEVI